MPNDEEAAKRLPEYVIALKVYCPWCGRHKGALCSTGEDWRWQGPHRMRLAKAKERMVAHA